MTGYERRFRVQFPKLKMPENYGGLPALVIFSMQKPGEPLIAYATCVDINGRVHMHVPLSVAELRTATENAITLVEGSESERQFAPAVSA